MYVTVDFVEDNKINKERVKFIIAKDLILRSPFWALVMVISWGILSFITIWVIMNLILPPYEKHTKEKHNKNNIEIK